MAHQIPSDTNEYQTLDNTNVHHASDANVRDANLHHFGDMTVPSDTNTHQSQSDMNSPVSPSQFHHAQYPQFPWHLYGHHAPPYPQFVSVFVPVNPAHALPNVIAPSVTAHETFEETSSTHSARLTPATLDLINKQSVAEQPTVGVEQKLPAFTVTMSSASRNKMMTRPQPQRYPHENKQLMSRNDISPTINPCHKYSRLINMTMTLVSPVRYHGTHGCAEIEMTLTFHPRHQTVFSKLTIVRNHNQPDTARVTVFVPFTHIDKKFINIVDMYERRGLTSKEIVSQLHTEDQYSSVKNDFMQRYEMNPSAMVSVIAADVLKWRLVSSTCKLHPIHHEDKPVCDTDHVKDEQFTNAHSFTHFHGGSRFKCELGMTCNLMDNAMHNWVFVHTSPRLCKFRKDCLLTGKLSHKNNFMH